jgi:pheromone shutdown protein TraB
MKYLSFFATIGLQFLSVLTLKLLDSFWLVIAIFILTLVVGGVMNFSRRETETTMANTIGWGLFYGSLTSLGLVLLFTIWLAFNFPK